MRGVELECRGLCEVSTPAGGSVFFLSQEVGSDGLPERFLSFALSCFDIALLVFVRMTCKADTRAVEYGVIGSKLNAGGLPEEGHGCLEAD